MCKMAGHCCHGAHLSSCTKVELFGIGKHDAALASNVCPVSSHVCAQSTL